ncbi:MAG: hypothetical protein GIS02_05785 [Methanosarcinales archaeon]|uniref:Uncharacterized protein n=1 Tax=Candidatus Ethanoperedens thermophilum TaxID=2766897 RepID=A0A848DBG1_9EURY|nr:hypothetical protein [Candidatus Ethanoperedens thermophilum]
MKYKLMLLTILIIFLLLILILPIIPTSENIQGKEEFLIIDSSDPDIHSEIKRISEKQTIISVELFEKEKKVVLESDDWKLTLEYCSIITALSTATATYPTSPPFKRDVELIEGVYPKFIGTSFY